MEILYMSANFLYRALKTIREGNYNDNEIRMYFDYIKTFDDKKMNIFLDSYSSSEYNNDLEIYIELIDNLNEICEANEDYEKCVILQNKKKESLDIICENNLKT